MRFCLYLLILFILAFPEPVLGDPPVAYRLHIAKAKERLVDIARHYGVSIIALRGANPHLPPRHPLQGGEAILIPLQTATPLTPRPDPDPKKSPPIPAFWIHTVRKGETLRDIAHHFRVPIELLASVNAISPTTILIPGQVLMVPVLDRPFITSPPRSLKEKGSKALTASDPSRPPVLPAPRIFGYVGVTLQDTLIRSAPQPFASVLSRCPKGVRLVIVDERPKWWGVLMINGATGWVLKGAVRKTDEPILWRDIQRLFRDGTGERVVREALRYLGVPYRYGGNSLSSGLDCSAFVQRVFARCGVRLPRKASQQAKVGRVVPRNQLRPGDRLYFAVKGSHVDHCGIYIGDGLFIHASRRHGAIVLSRLSDPPYNRSLVVIRR